MSCEFISGGLVVVAMKPKTNISLLRATVDAVPRYVTNDMIHRDLCIPTVPDVIHDRSITVR